MPATTRTPLGAPTTNRKWFLDVRPVGSTADEGWLGFHGVTEMAVNPGTGNTQDDSDFDSRGYKSQAVTSLSAGVTGKCVRKTLASDPTAYDPGQELVRLASTQIGPGNVVEARVYEMEEGGPRVEAYQGYVSTTWTPDGGNMEALDTVSWQLLGRGQLAPITHPDAGGAGAQGFTASSVAVPDQQTVVEEEPATTSRKAS